MRFLYNFPFFSYTPAIYHLTFHLTTSYGWQESCNPRYTLATIRISPSHILNTPSLIYNMPSQNKISPSHIINLRRRIFYK